MRNFLENFTFAFAILLTAGSASGAECVVTSLRERLSRSLVTEASPNVSIGKLSSEIAARRARVPEFEFIKSEAERRGLRVWLFGGTAAGYGHYVKWDLLREAGDLRFQKERFDYDYTNIYRSTQDLDIVVDGSAKQAQEFQQALKARFPFFMGSKATPWEVRSLREASDDKGALLDDFSFMNQHTDSNSTGMIELTNPPKGESLVRDLRDWRARGDSQFLKDVHQDKLTYYFSPTHDRTARARAGKNPPIFSVIRALTKAFQYDLKFRDQDLAVMKKEIDQFSPIADLKTPEALYWIEKNGKKLYQHAVDIEYASSVLEKLGLKRKLIAIQNNPKTIESLAWWMSKEPLPSKPVGQGSGRTAKELGISEVAHETNSFLAYESITRAHTGAPNVLISRRDGVGEGAVYGDGFYTAIGKKGARGTGITIRFEVNPGAREGEDFVLASGNGKGQYVVFKNKNAIRVIPESLEMSPSEYFQFLAEGKEISVDDQALIWKLKRRIQGSIAAGSVDPSELQKIRKLVVDEMRLQSPNSKLVFHEWLRLEGARAGKPRNEVDTLIDWIEAKTYRADPAPTMNGLLHLTYGTEADPWMRREFVPSLLKDLKPDVGEQAIENALASNQSEVRDFGIRALEFAEKNRPSDRIAALRRFINDPKAAQAWFRQDLKRNSTLPIFEKLAARDPEALAILKRARAESFQFKKFDVPREGAKFLFGGKPDGSPIREVKLTRPFEIQATPVTQLQWLLVMQAGRNPAAFRGGGEMLHGVPLQLNHPMEQVSWLEVQAFIARLNELDPHYQYRLPTEAEWEAAAIAGTKTQYSFGDDAAELSDYGWSNANSDKKTHEVASLKPNPMGLYDMHGNVENWVEDSWSETRPSGVDPLNTSKHIGRVVRGGSWRGHALMSRSDHRDSGWNHNVYENIGFRLVRVPK